MKKLLTVWLCVFLLCVSAAAADYSVTRLVTDCSAEKSGVCRIRQSVDFTALPGVTSVTLPVAANAERISVTGADYSVRKEGGASYAVLRRESGFSGEQHAELSYTVRGTIGEENGKQTFSVCLTDGLWETPVERYSATVLFPGDLSAEPVFSSGYYDADLGDRLTTHRQGGIVSTVLRGGLLDHESFSVSLAVSQPIFHARGGEGAARWLIPLAVFLLLALGVAYWFFTLRQDRLTVRACTYPPDAATPAETSMILNGSGVRFSLLVCHWAVAGYLTISVSGGKVHLLRTMDMGSECRAEERRLFEELFSDGDECLCGTACYARVSQHARQILGGYWAKRLFDRSGGNVMLLRGAAALSCGIALASGLASILMFDGFFRFLLVTLASIAGIFCGWLVTLGFGEGQFRRIPMIAAAGVSALFLYFMGRLSDGMLVMLPALALAIFTSVVTMHGGRHTAAGSAIVEALLGYRRHLGHISAGQLTQMLSGDRQSFYSVLLFSVSFGMAQTVMAQLPPEPLPPCIWLDLPGKPRTPQQLSHLLDRLLRKMDEV